MPNKQHLHELEAEENTKDILLAMLSHDMATPLMVSILHLNRLKNGSGSYTEQQIESFRCIEKNLNQLRETMRRTREIQSTLLGKVSPSVEKVDLVDVVEDVCRNLEVVFEQKKIKVVVDKSAIESLFIQTDLSLLRDHILVNILTNSFKYSEKNSIVEIEFFDDGDLVCLQIRDQGAGLGSKTFDSVATFNSKGELGHGFGFPIINALLQVLGGMLEIANNPNHIQGTQITVFLPRKIMSL